MQDVKTSPLDDAQYVEVESGLDMSQNSANLLGLATNYSNQNKWFAYFPLESVLGTKYKNINLHLTRFSLPQMMMQSMTASFKGYTVEMPTKVLDPDSKELTLEYIVDEKWQNYRALFSWMSGIYGSINKVSSEQNTSIMATDFIPLRIYLLDSFKKKIIQFLFENCWIKSFNDLSLDVNNPAETTHSFTIVYSNYSIEDI